MSPRKRSVRFAEHVIDRRLDLGIRQADTGATCRHSALLPDKTFDRVLIERVVALGNARRPLVLVTDNGCAAGTGGP